MILKSGHENFLPNSIQIITPSPYNKEKISPFDKVTLKVIM